MKNNKLLISLLGMIIVIVVCIVIFMASNKQTEPKVPDNTTDFTIVTAPPIVKEPEDISVEPKNYYDSYSYCDTDVIIRSINCPVITSEEFKTDVINESLEGYCEKFIKISSSAKLQAEEEYDTSLRYGTDFEPIDKSADYSIYKHDNFLSVTFNISQTAGISGTLNTKDPMCFDLKNDKPASISDVLGISEDDAAYIVESKFIELIDKSPEDFNSDAKDVLRDEIDIYSFELSDDGIIVTLDPYVIAPGAFGSQSVFIKY